MVDERRGVVDGLAIERGSTLLEVCTGPSVYQRSLARALGEAGRLAARPVARDAAPLRRAHPRPGSRPLLVQANGAALPFGDRSFDAVFHFGGIKLFTAPEQAIRECARVLRKGGRLFLADEGFSPELPAGTCRRQILTRINPDSCASRRRSLRSSPCGSGSGSTAA